MKVYISLNGESKKYHLPECPIAQEMKYPHRRKIAPGTAVEEGLLHLNEYKGAMSDSELRNGAFHRQSDMKPTYSPGRILNYVAEHDRAAEIMAVDYTKLPRTTQKEKKYYRRAEERSKHPSHKRMDMLFDLIEAQNPEICSVRSVLLD